MKIKFILSLGAALAITFTSCSQILGGKVELKDQTDSVSYALGYMEASQYVQQFSNEAFPFDTIDQKVIAKAFSNSKLRDNYLKVRKEQFDSINVEVFMKAFQATIAGSKDQSFNDASADLVLRTKYDQVRNKLQAVADQEAVANIEIGRKFLEENKAKAGVVALPSGLQYQVLTQGTGVKPALTDEVKCHYHGTLIDGTVFDSSVDRGEPTSFPVNGVIAGWTEALQLMPVGSKWKLFIPSSLAYGSQGAGEKIKGNSTLVFEVELLEIVKK